MLSWRSCSSIGRDDTRAVRPQTKRLVGGLDSARPGAAAEMLTIAVVLAGVAIFGYFVSQLVAKVVPNLEGGALRERRRRRMIEQLRDHFVIRGYGRVGRRAAAGLAVRSCAGTA